MINLFNLRCLAGVLVLVVLSVHDIIGQACTGSQVTLSIVDARITASNKFTFELWVQNTGSVPERISAYGGGIVPNVALTSGYTVIVLEQPSILGWDLNNMNPNVTQTANIRWTNNPNANSTRVLNAGSAAVKIAKFEVTSTAIPASLTFSTSGTVPQMTSYCSGNPNSNAMTFANGKLIFANGNAPVLLAPLPVELDAFSAEKAGERRARLSWSTESEINASHFEVERSFDNSHFESIGKVSANGNTTSRIDYHFFDERIPEFRNQTIVYYRLRMVDLDGSFEYSEVRGLNFDKSNTVGVAVFPNPTNQWVHIDVSNFDFETENVNLMVFDLKGRLILKKEILGAGLETLDVSQLCQGVYQLVVQQGDILYRERVVRVE